MIDLREARSLAIKSQLLSPDTPLKDKAGTIQAIKQLGYIQIDTISVVARAHHHTLWSRVSNYKREWLAELEVKDRAIFEYWAHAASYLPMKDYRFSLKRKEDFLHGNAYWFKKDPKTTKYVLDRIKAEGPLMSKDFKTDKKSNSNSTGMDWTRNPLNLALRQLFMEGRIMVAYRRGFQKAYDIPENILPSDVNTKYPSRKEYLKYLIERDIRAHGLVRQKEIGYLIKNTGKEIGDTLKEMVTEGILKEIKIKGLASQSYFALADSLNSFEDVLTQPQLCILSPFDNLVIQRSRAAELFDFNYTLECYVPAAKRKVGYFSLPLLWGTELIGQLDGKADRKARIFYIKNLVWEKKVRLGKAFLAALRMRLKDYASFNACAAIKVVETLEKRIDPVLKKCLES